MTSSKPYLIRGLYEWLLDNDATPYVLIDSSSETVEIPKGIASNDGKVVLNLAPGAIQNLEMTNDYLSFSARFSGVAQNVFCPIKSVLAIYARENGKGMMFAEDNQEDEFATDPKQALDKDKKSKPPGLKVVK
ncbi:MAG: ClpXP protease specificity-enhancing factor [Gammaproteobacteria bacterium]|nr:ClpXP protease specificity-enhancing factor [Gammaproteobacteria bacterium]